MNISSVTNNSFYSRVIFRSSMVPCIDFCDINRIDIVKGTATGRDFKFTEVARARFIALFKLFENCTEKQTKITLMDLVSRSIFLIDWVTSDICLQAGYASVKRQHDLAIAMNTEMSQEVQKFIKFGIEKFPNDKWYGNWWTADNLPTEFVVELPELSVLQTKKQTKTKTNTSTTTSKVVAQKRGKSGTDAQKVTSLKKYETRSNAAKEGGQSGRELIMKITSTSNAPDPSGRVLRQRNYTTSNCEGLIFICNFNRSERGGGGEGKEVKKGKPSTERSEGAIETYINDTMIIF
jgi:hypothetical protein